MQDETQLTVTVQNLNKEKNMFLLFIIIDFNLIISVLFLY